MKRAKVYMHDRFAGILMEDDQGFHFTYNSEYSRGSESVSLTLPTRDQPYFSKVMFPFFDGLIPEGWLLDIATKNWKLDAKDRMSILLATCRDCIGAVSIMPFDDEG